MRRCSALLLFAACTSRPAPDQGTDSGSEETGPSLAQATDWDGDTIADIHEGQADPDDDGLPNDHDLDSDGDGLDDAVEAGDDDVQTVPVDTDLDGLADFLDLDADGNCIPDVDEGAEDRDGDGLLDPLDLDDDGDGLRDVDELADCAPVDTDDDGLPDHHDLDSDGDGIADADEGGSTGAPVDSDGDGQPDHRDLDADGDGLADSDERGPDGAIDTDGDGHFDHVDPDSDGDGIADTDEVAHGTDRLARDSDGDGFTDLAEQLLGTDPLDPEQPVADGRTVQVEVPARNEVELALPWVLDLRRPDLVMIIDTTTSMSLHVPVAISDLLVIAREFSADAVEVNIGVATFQEFAALPMSYGQDHPFALRQQLTGDLVAAKAALSSVRVDPGAGNVDFPESSMEALYQALTGQGYDMDCDTLVDDDGDVRPFIASSDDPFGGLGGQSYDPTDASTGLLGGAGFREASQAILLLVTDAEMRDPEAGYAVPGGCPGEAGFSDVVAAAAELQATIIGLDVLGSATPQMEELAVATGSLWDLDGSGGLDPLVFDYDPGDEDGVAQLVEVIDGIGRSQQVEVVEPIIAQDVEGFVVEAGPIYTNVTDRYEHGDSLPFLLTLRGVAPPGDVDAAFLLEVQVQADGVAVHRIQLVVVVPWG